MMRLDVGGHQLAIDDRGAGPPILFVHGFPLHHAMWDAQLEALSATHRVLAPDLRGFGQSEVTSGPVTMEEFADDLYALLDPLEVFEPVTLCGLSMGGYIAFAFWKKYGSRVRSLILCATRSTADQPEAAKQREHLAEKVLANGTGAVVELMVPRLLAPGTPERLPKVVAQVIEMVSVNDPMGVAAALRGLAIRPDVTDLLPTIKVPALVVAGEEDAITAPQTVRAIAEKIDGARFVTVPNAGHLIPMENPRQFNAELARFLNP